MAEMDDTIIKLKEQACNIRKKILKMIVDARAAHIGTSLSSVEILVALYFSVLNVDPQNPEWEDRDRFILSKGNGAAALYATLAERGFFPVKTLDTFAQNGSTLIGHADLQVPGVEASTGSLGLGLSVGVGMSLAGKSDNRSYRVFVLLGDGECDEGSVWEAAMSASHYKLDNLTAVIDHNKLQATGFVKEVMSQDPILEKWRSFGWSAREIDGHNMEELLKTLKETPFEKNKPSAIIAHTVKGKGISFLENDVISHYKCPNEEETAQAIKELEQAAGAIVESKT